MRQEVPLPRWHFLQAEHEFDVKLEGDRKRAERELRRLEKGMRSGEIGPARIADARRQAAFLQRLIERLSSRVMADQAIVDEMVTRWKPGGYTAEAFRRGDRIADTQFAEHHGFLAPAMAAAYDIMSVVVGMTAPLEQTFSAGNVPKVVLHEQLCELLMHHDLTETPWADAEPHLVAEAMRDRMLPANRVVVRLPPAIITSYDGRESVTTTDIEVYGISRETLIADARRFGYDVHAEVLTAFPARTPLFLAYELNKGGPEQQPTPRTLMHGGLLARCPSPLGWAPLSGTDAISVFVYRTMVGLLEFWNEPNRTFLQRAGIRFVLPLQHRRRQNLGRAQRVRYEWYGERVRMLEAPQAILGGDERSILRRYFVRGHWARWPILPAGDPIREVAWGAIRDLAPPTTDGDDLAAFMDALYRRIDAEMDLSRRTYDVIVRLLVTWDIENTGTPGLHPLLDCPWWNAHRDTLWPQLREQGRRRRSYRMPHWRGPEGSETIDAVTIISPEGGRPPRWRGDAP